MNTTRRMPAIATCLALLLAAPASATEWNTAPGSSLGFSGTSQGESFDGRFARFSAKVRFDPAAPGDASFEVVVDTASVDTDNSERDETLLTEDFFGVERWPQARWSARRARPDGDGFAAAGMLELRDVRRPVPLRFRFTPTAGGAVLEGEATLDRLDFDVGGGDWADPEAIGREVIVRTRLVLVPAGG